MEQLTEATQTGQSDKGVSVTQAVVINEQLKNWYPELYVHHSTKKTTSVRQACDDLVVYCKKYTVLKCHVANYRDLPCCRPPVREQPLVPIVLPEPDTSDDSVIIRFFG